VKTQKTEHTYQQQLAAAQAEIAEQKAEIARLQHSLEQRTQDINRLIQWMQSLQQDILAVYNSVSWQTGHLITRIALKLLRRDAGPTARDHINQLLNSFESWKINYFQSRRQQGLQPYIPWHDNREYTLWIKEHECLNQAEQAALSAQMADWPYQPIISLLMAYTDENDADCLQASIESLHGQIFKKWELCFAYQGTLPDNLLTLLESDHRISCVNIPENKPLAHYLNCALNLASGEFIALMGAADQLPAQALYQIVESLNTSPETDLIYTDHDYLDAQGRRCDPYFKSDWNPDLFYSQNFLNHLTVYRRRLLNQIAQFNADYPGHEEYDFTLRFIEQITPKRIRHIPKILYHQRTKKKANEVNANSACQALQAHFQRLNQTVQVVEAVAGQTRVIYPLPSEPPLVSLIIPTRDKLTLLHGTVSGLLNQTDYKPIEIIIIDNGSVEAATLAYLEEIQNDKSVSVIRHQGPFNYSKLNNLGIYYASGEIIGLLNNDLEVISSGWLTEMVSHALRPDIGAVGAKLYYANDTIQHAGVIVGLGGMAGHGFKFLAREAPGYHWKPFLIQNYSAVTAACLIMRRAVFEEVGGLNEKDLKVAFNDVDLCLRIREQGYRIVWTPYAELYHLESASRGSDNTLKKHLRLRHELNYMKSKWAVMISNDPYYNPNLTIEYEDFSLAYPPRKHVN
jgi:O-antigen biosynthesis protein